MIFAPVLRDIELDEEFSLSEVFQDFDPLHLLYSNAGCKVWLPTENSRLLIVQLPDATFHTREVTYLHGLASPRLLDYEQVINLESSDLGEEVVSKKDISFLSARDLVLAHGLTFVEPEFFEDDYLSSLETYLIDRTIYSN